MRKIYTIVCSILLLASSSAAAEKVVSLSIYDLTNANLNTSYTDSENNLITVKTFELPFKGDETILYRNTVPNPLACVDENPTTAPSNGQYTTAIIKGFSTANVRQAPYIQLELPAEHKITDIEVLGYGTSGGSAWAEAELICGFSNTTSADASFSIDTDIDETVMTFPQATCATNNKRPLLYEDTKFIRLSVCRAFAGTGVTSWDSDVMVYAIRLYATKTVVGIEEENSDQFEIKVYDRNLQLTELADVQVYSLSGKKVLDLKKLSSTDLSFLNAGAYIIKAQSEQGKAKYLKVLLR